MITAWVVERTSVGMGRDEASPERRKKRRERKGKGYDGEEEGKAEARLWWWSEDYEESCFTLRNSRLVDPALFLRVPYFVRGKRRYRDILGAQMNLRRTRHGASSTKWKKILIFPSLIDASERERDRNFCSEASMRYSNRRSKDNDSLLLLSKRSVMAECGSNLIHANPWMQRYV